jgi:hypothetical protein
MHGISSNAIAIKATIVGSRLPGIPRLNNASTGLWSRAVSGELRRIKMAYISGKTDEEIIVLVAQHMASRKKLGTDPAPEQAEVA